MSLLTRSCGARRPAYPLRGEEILAAVPSIGRAVRVEGAPAPEADLTRALYEQYANQIFRYCLHQLGSREEAEDAVQSTFLNAFRGIKRGIVPELESAWLFKIAHNVCLSRRRTTWRRGRIESPTDFDVVEEMTPAPSRRADELMGLQDVLEQMPENQRRAILLREWQGLSYREISEELELSQAAVETLIFRARRSLAAGLEKPPEAKKRKLVRGADLGNIFAGVKSLLVGGGAAAKVAATIAVVSAGTVAAGAPVQQQRTHSHQSSTPAAAPAVRTTRPAAGSASSVAGPAVGGKHDTKARGHAKRRHVRTLGLASSGALSERDDSTVTVPPAEQAASVAVGPAPADPAETPPTPAPPAPATPSPPSIDSSKTEGSATSSAAKSAGDSQGNVKNGGAQKNGGQKGSDAKKSNAAAVATPTVTLATTTVLTTTTSAPAAAPTPTDNVPAAAPSSTQAGEGKLKDHPNGKDRGN